MENINYKKEYHRLVEEVAKMLVENRRNYKNPMSPFQLLSKWDEIREPKDNSGNETDSTKINNMANITINGKNYSGNNVVVINGEVIIDGNEVTPDSKEISIQISGDINDLKVDSCRHLFMVGNVKNIKTVSGDVNVTGNVSGNISTTSGDVNCNNVDGEISTISGDVNYVLKD